MRRSAAAISARRAITAASGVGMRMAGPSRRSAGGLLGRPLFSLPFYVGPGVAPANKKPRPLERGLVRNCSRDGSALARFEAGIDLVDNVDAALAPDDAPVLVALLDRLHPIRHLHTPSSRYPEPDREAPNIRRAAAPVHPAARRRPDA